MAGGCRRKELPGMRSGYGREKATVIFLVGIASWTCFPLLF